MDTNLLVILALGLLILGVSPIYRTPFLSIAEGQKNDTTITPYFPPLTRNALGVLGDSVTYLSNNIVDTNAYYDVMFRTGSTDNIATIDVVFPSGTNVRDARIIEASGVSAGSSSIDRQTVTYTIPSAPLVQAGTTIRLEFANVVNPSTPNSNLKLQITTKASDGSIIDSGTSDIYSIKQISSANQLYKIQSNLLTVGPGQYKFGYADCGATGLLINGGYLISTYGPFSTISKVYVFYNSANGNEWEVDIMNQNTIPYEFLVYATCLRLK